VNQESPFSLGSVKIGMLPLKMFILVILVNVFISIVFFYIAIRIWRFKQKLIFLTDSINSYELAIHTALHTASESIDTRQEQIHSLRQKYTTLQLQIQKLQQILSLILLGIKIWQYSNDTIQQFRYK
jgi:hypothetical protein